MGAVYVATQSTLDRDVALKVLLPMYADAPDYRARFAREAAALARVDSPNIIQIFDYGEHEGRLFIATQLVSGGDLGRYLHERGELPVAAACLMAAQIAAALADAHEAGVIHRDVKPGNVLLRGSGDRPHVYLCDFGIATDGGPGLTTTGAVAGTWAYLAPERCEGADASRASDVYALGCLLWQLLTGSPPYVGSPAHVAMQHLTAAIPQMAADDDETTDSLNALLRRLLAKEVEERESDAAAASVELERIGRLAAHGDAGHARPAKRTAPPPSDAEPKWASSPRLGAAEVDTDPLGGGTPDLALPAVDGRPRRRRRRRTFIALALAAVLGVVGGLGAWLLLDRNQDDEDPPSAGGSKVQISHRLTTGDFNGDQQADGLVQVAAGKGSSDLMLVPGTDAESGPPSVWAKDTRIPLGGALTAGDVDGDKVADVLGLWRGDGERMVYLYTGGPAGLSDAAEVGVLPVEGSVAMVAGNFNGDAFADLVAMATDDAGRSQLFLLTYSEELAGYGEAQPQAWHPEWPAEGTVIRVADVDGDGDGDVVALPAETDEVWVFRADGGQLAEGELWGSVERQPDSHIVTTDFDGDRRADLAVVVDGDDGAEVRVARSEGDEYQPAETWLTIPDWTVATMWVARASIDDDSVVDLMVLHQESDHVALSALLSDGEEFAPPAPLRSVEDWQW